VRNRGDHDVLIALNGLYRDTIPAIRASFEHLLPQENIVVWEALKHASPDEPANKWRHRAAEFMREAFLASLQSDMLLVTSLFEGFNEDAVSSIGLFSDKIPTAVIVYDLIPHIYSELYLPLAVNQQWYSDKLDSLRRAGQWLMISDASRQEAIALLGLPEDRCITISAAADPKFLPRVILPEEEARIGKAYGINRPFILSAGGELRKNIERLIEAYAGLASAMRESHQLVVYGYSKPEDHQLLHSWAKKHGLHPDQLVLTPHIADDDLITLYNLCSLFVFPSWHEGFGFPALEAMQCGAPVLGANASGIPEVIGREDALFDPYSQADITAKIERVLIDGAFRNELRRYGPMQAEKFSWNETAIRALKAMEAYSATRAAVGAWRRNRESSLHKSLIDRLASIPRDEVPPSEHDLLASAEAIAANRRATPLPEHITWRIEGPFDSSYSLALLNRETARALRELGHCVVLHSTDGPGDFLPNQSFLRANPDLAELYAQSATTLACDVDVTSRNLYPPRVADMHSRLNLLHHYAWEESGFPADWVEDFNRHLEGVTCLSSHVKKILVDHGVTARLSVSGCGVSHWERIAPDATYSVDGRGFRFLHVSSCFPRKGADVLLKAYGSAFTNVDDVTLVIKTFDNPHNEIEKWLAEAKHDRSDFPDVVIIKEDLSDAQLKALYGQCDALVAPGRAEGFGLPLAEAMLSGLSVITTGWGGQCEFCNDETAWLIDYSFTYARTHLGLFDSVWAEPDADQLASLMRKVYALPAKERRARSLCGRNLLLRRFAWTKVAERLVESARSWGQTEAASAPRIGWVTSWNTRCGIATYSAHLIGNMPADIIILASHTDSPIESDCGNVRRCWRQGEEDDLQQLNSTIDALGVDTLVVQFNYSFFNFAYLGAFLDRQTDAGRKVIVMLHSTADQAFWGDSKPLAQLSPSFVKCDRLLVHAPSDLNRLKRIGLVENVTLFPHGGVDYMPVKRPERIGFLVASYGFFLPHKGLLELIESIGMLRSRGMNARLRMVNAAYPIPTSSELIATAKTKIEKAKLAGHAELITDFLPDEESLALLCEADLVVFPYQDTAESASGAVRYGLMSGRPVAVTPLPIFDDVASAVFRLPGTAVEDIANGIAEAAYSIKNGTAEAHSTAARAERWRAAHRYSHLGRRLYGMLVALQQADHETASSGFIPRSTDDIATPVAAL